MKGASTKTPCLFVSWAKTAPRSIALVVGTKQMVQDFPIISVNTRKEEYLGRYSSFSEKFPVEKSVPFDFSPEQLVSPCR